MSVNCWGCMTGGRETSFTDIYSVCCWGDGCIPGDRGALHNIGWECMSAAGEDSSAVCQKIEELSRKREYSYLQEAIRGT